MFVRELPADRVTMIEATSRYLAETAQEPEREWSKK
jgi:hypothetical protein